MPSRSDNVMAVNGVALFLVCAKCKKYYCGTKRNGNSHCNAPFVCNECGKEESECTCVGADGGTLIGVFDSRANATPQNTPFSAVLVTPRTPTISVMDIAITRMATEKDIPVIAKIAKGYSRELGFVMNVALKESIARGTLTVAEWNGKIVGFVNYRLKRDDTVTVYEIAVHQNYLRSGLGALMLNSIDQLITLKCPVDNAGANAFYAKVGFTMIRTEKGRKRELNVWQRKGKTRQ